MLAGSVPGSFAGLYILQICSGAVLQGAVGLLLLYYVYWQMTYRAAQGPVSHPQMLGAAAGFGAGLLGTAISFDGPPIGAYGLCMGWEPRVFLGTLGVFFVIRGSLTVILQATAGFYTPEAFGLCLVRGARRHPGHPAGLPRGQAHPAGDLPQGVAGHHRRGRGGLPGARLPVTPVSGA